MLNFEEINPYYKKVTLIGMMGTGKSKFGRQIANILKYNFYDIDYMIEKELQITIKQIFQKHGEVFFRKIEKKTIRDLILKINKNKEKVIISLGGGGFDNKEIRDLLLSNTNVIVVTNPVPIAHKIVFASACPRSRDINATNATVSTTPPKAALIAAAGLIAS